MSTKVYELDKGLTVIKRKIEIMKKKNLRPPIVGVTGGSGSGKTTKVAEKIKEFFPGSAILSMDDYFKGRRFMKSINSHNFDEPRVIDLDLLASHLELLKVRLPIQKPVYSFTIGEREGYIQFEPASLIILEGLFTLREPIVNKVDLKIFVDISIHGSLLRRLLRDVGRTGQTEKDIFEQYVETVYPMYKLHVEPTKSQADIVIVNQYQPDVEAEGCGQEEIQVKARLNREFFLDSLMALGFRKVSSVVLQEDTYYSAPNWKMGYKNELMRIRKESDKYFLAYKGPSCGGLLRKKQKIEFEVEPASKDALEKLGYEKFLSFSKKRRRFVRNDALELAFDQFDDGSRFLEFRAKNKAAEAEIVGLLKKLGIKRKDVTKKSYLEILLSKKTSA